MYRLYRLEILGLRRRKGKRRTLTRGTPSRAPVTGRNQVWAMDFVSLTLDGGRRVRLLTVLDIHTRESVAIRAAHRFSAEMVAAVLDEVAAERGVPPSIRVDNGPEFAGRTLDLWAYGRTVALDFSRPGQPTDNAFIESSHGRLRDEFLDRSVFADVADAASQAAWFRREYNTVRPHSGLDYRTPQAFAATCGPAGTSDTGGTTPPTPTSA